MSGIINDGHKSLNVFYPSPYDLLLKTLLPSLDLVFDRHVWLGTCQDFTLCCVDLYSKMIDAAFMIFLVLTFGDEIFKIGLSHS